MSALCQHRAIWLTVALWFEVRIVMTLALFLLRSALAIKSLVVLYRV